MPANFTNFMIKLAKDPNALAQFRTSSAETMTKAGLSPAEQTVVQSRNASLIHDAIVADSGRTLGAGSAAASDIVIVVVL